MSLDIAVVGSPFLDLTFEGLEGLPRVGEETLAQALHVCPGGTGMQAVAAARLGLATGLVAPLSRVGLASLVREMLEVEGVAILDAAEPPELRGRPGVPVTALLTTAEGVAMATVLDPAEPAPTDVARPKARALVASLGRLWQAPEDATVYALTGALELPEVAEGVLERVAGTRALVTNAAEAAALSGIARPEDAARWLAGSGTTAVVTLGALGAVAAEGDSVHRAPAPEVTTVDATGAGDLFAAAYVWADLGGAPLPDRLAWACLYAGLSVRAPTAFAGAVRLEQLLTEGELRDLAPPPGVA